MGAGKLNCRPVLKYPQQRMSAGLFYFIVNRRQVNINSGAAMKKSKAELEKEISHLMADFLDQQMGEHASSVDAFLSGNTVTVRATNCLSPGERNFVQNEKDWHLLKEFKNQQFEQVKLQLKERLEQITDCEVLNIVSVVGQDGMRFEVVTLSQNFEN